MEQSVHTHESEELLVNNLDHEHDLDHEDGSAEEPYAFQAHAFPLLLLLLITAWIHLPSLSAGLPFFYQEDEAHHYNRTVRMVQSGDFNPHYFHKPSLHFYLRMPVVMASFLWTVKEGGIRKVGEIQTRDTFGVGEYAFTASHPGIVKWNRAFSLLLFIGSVLLTYSILQLLGASRSGGLFAGLLVALSPTAFHHATTIGVDVVVTFFALLTMLMSLKALNEQAHRTRLTIISGLCAGLTISTKYNALPIALIPLITALLLPEKYRQQIPAQFGLSLLAIVGGFLLGSPYILAELPLFLDQFAYEIWHYGTAGHVGNEANPGIEQATHYLKWLLTEGIGPIGGSMALIGALLALLSRKSNARERLHVMLPLLFLLLYMGLMISQKANFTRNMLLALPFFAICAALCAEWLLYLRAHYYRLVRTGLCSVALLFIFLPTLRARSAATALTDSREVLIREYDAKGLQTVCAGELWLSTEQARQMGCREAAIKTATPLALFQSGAERIILPQHEAEPFIASKLYSELHTIPGVLDDQRVVNNPAITILQRNYEEKTPLSLIKEIISSEVERKFDKQKLTAQPPCSPGPMRNEDEPGCWLTQRFTPIFITGPKSTSFLLSTPWEPQTVQIYNEQWQEVFASPMKREETLRVALQGDSHYTISITTVRQPSLISGSADTRLLGIQIR